MPELDETVLEKVGNRRERLLVDEFVEIVEHHHPTEGRGVARDAVHAYFDELDERTGADAEGFRHDLADRLTDDESYAGSDAVYEVGEDRVSAYPAEWHERLDADDSLAAYVDVMTDAADDPPGSAASPGVPEDDLLDAAAVLGGRDRDEARGELEDLRAEGVLVSDADQHPRAGVAVADDVDFEKEQFDKPDWGDRSTE